jgi:hypothetical protein
MNDPATRKAMALKNKREQKLDLMMVNIRKAGIR